MGQIILKVVKMDTVRNSFHFPSMTVYVKSDTIHISLVPLVCKVESIKETFTAIRLS